MSDEFVLDGENPKPFFRLEADIPVAEGQVSLAGIMLTLQLYPNGIKATTFLQSLTGAPVFRDVQTLTELNIGALIPHSKLPELIADLQHISDRFNK